MVYDTTRASPGRSPSSTTGCASGPAFLNQHFGWGWVRGIVTTARVAPARLPFPVELVRATALAKAMAAAAWIKRDCNGGAAIVVPERESAVREPTPARSIDPAPFGLRARRPRAPRRGTPVPAGSSINAHRKKPSQPRSRYRTRKFVPGPRNCRPRRRAYSDSRNSCACKLEEKYASRGSRA